MTALVDEYALRLLEAIRELRKARFKELTTFVQNPRTLSSKLKLLREQGLVEMEGSSYTLTELGIRVLVKLTEIEELLRARPKILNVERIPHAFYAPLIKRFCEKLHEVLGDRLVSIVLFGSVARGDWRRDSDIDLLVVAEGWEGKPLWERLREIRRAESGLEATPEYQRAVNAGYTPVIQPYPLSKDEAGKFQMLYLDLLLDGILLYDKESFMAETIRSMRRRLEEVKAVKVTLPNGQHYWIFGEGKVVTLE